MHFAKASLREVCTDFASAPPQAGVEGAYGAMK